ncbi:MAG: YbaN family protein [Motiliproteus sp.]|nr:YbaN family protein [Motiliproteus sp.]MCW9050861.1 YbaN family protein [Motiliproteus sp.]
MILIYRTVGVLSLALGTLGVFLPLLPTTCFVLLSAWCFARSSPRYYRWITENRLFGKIISQWQQRRCISNRIKWVAIASMSISVSYSIWLIEQPVVQLTLVLLLAVGIFSVQRIKQCPIGPYQTVAKVRA